MEVSMLSVNHSVYLICRYDVHHTYCYNVPNYFKIYNLMHLKVEFILHQFCDKLGILFNNDENRIFYFGGSFVA